MEPSIPSYFIENRQRVLAHLPPVVVIAGHYGVGKTSFALNLAVDAARAGMQVTLADMDVVNPYFRSSEYAALLEREGVRLIAPVFGGAGTSLDVPSVTGELSVCAQEAYDAYDSNDVHASNDAHACHDAYDSNDAHDQTEEPRKVVIIDAGGDDVGATVLARFAPALKRGPYALWYVVNAYRNATQDPSDAVAILREIEAKSHLVGSAIVGNSHLQQETTWTHITNGAAFAQEVAALSGLELLCVTANDLTIQQAVESSFNRNIQHFGYPVFLHTVTPWEG